MISTSYDLDDSNHRNSSASINDEESIFLSSSSDEDLPLSSRFNIAANKAQNSKYMDTMINDGLGQAEEDEEDEEESIEQVSDEEECEYIPTSTFTEDVVEDVSDEEPPTKIYDEYDPENLDSFNDSSLLKQTYEPTKKSSSEESIEEISPEVKKVRKTRSQKTWSPEPEVRVKRKYVRKQAVADDASSQKSDSSSGTATKRPYNNTKRAKNAARKKNADTDANRTDNNELGTMQGSPVSDESLSDAESHQSKESQRSSKKVRAVDADNDSGINKKKKSVSSEATKVISKAAANVISGRIINLSSGFKIPKRPSNEIVSEKSIPPEKRPKTDDTTSTKAAQPIKPLSKLKAPTPGLVKSLPESKTLSKTVTSKPTTKTITKEPIKTSSSSSSSSTQAKTMKPKKKVELKESDFFMDALGPSTHSVRAKPKVVKQASIAKRPVTDQSEATRTATTSSIPSNQSSLNSSNLNNNIRVTSPSQQTDQAQSTDNLPYPSTESTNLTSGEPKSNLTEPGLRKLNKKKVVWADHHSRTLENVSYFYLDEIEREIKKNAFKGDNRDMAKIEKLNEKEMKFKHQDNYNLNEPTEDSPELPWPTLMKIDLPDSIKPVTISSAEHEIQVAREQSTLGVLMFKQFLPDSPSEPTDTNNLDIIATKAIPLEDVTLNQSSDIDTPANSQRNESPFEPDHVKSINHQQEASNGSYSPSDAPFQFNNSTGDVDNRSHHHHNYHGKEHHHSHHNNNNKSQHQHRQQLQENLLQRKEPVKLFTPASPPRSPSTVLLDKEKSNVFLPPPIVNLMVPPPKLSTPTSPTLTAPKLYSKLVEDSPDAKKKPEPSAQAPSTDTNLINISNNLLASNEMTEKIKNILNQINLTSTKPASTEQRSPTGDAPKTPESVTNNIELPAAFTTVVGSSNANTEYKRRNSDEKPSKWSTSSNTYNNSSNNKYGQNNNYGINNNSSQKNSNDFNNQRTNNNNNNNNNNGTNTNRNQFTGNFRRGIGHKTHTDNYNHNSFNQRNSYNNDQHNNTSKYNRGASHGGFNSNRSNRPYQSRFDNNGNQKNEPRYGNNDKSAYHNHHQRSYSNKESNYENDSPPKAAKQATTTVASATGKGGWL